MDIAKHVDELRKKIRRASELYYDKDSPEISDYEYDMMFEELKKLEKEHPELDSADSPTHRVGGTASEKFEKVTHPVKMGSLSDVFSEDELRDFLTKTNAALAEYDISPDEVLYSVEPKIDGLSVSVTYSDGKLSLGATRGDGTVGENITENIPKDISHISAIEIKAAETAAITGTTALLKCSMAELVVLLTFLRIAQYAVSL